MNIFYCAMLFLLQAMIVFGLDDYVQQQDEPEYVYIFIPSECYKEFCQGEYSSKCLQETMSRIISVLIVFFAFLNQIPQIYLIVRYKSVQGISFNSCYIEMFLTTFNISYNLFIGADFMLYGEYVFLLIQYLFKFILFYIYDRTISQRSFYLKSLFYLFIAISLITQYVPNLLYQSTIYINMLLVFFVKYPQIHLNYRNQGTGQLSFLTHLQNQLGSLARIFTLFVSSTNIQFILWTLEDGALTIMLTIQFAIYYKNDRLIKRRATYTDISDQK